MKKSKIKKLRRRQKKYWTLSQTNRWAWVEMNRMAGAKFLSAARANTESQANYWQEEGETCVKTADKLYRRHEVYLAKTRTIEKKLEGR